MRRPTQLEVESNRGLRILAVIKFSKGVLLAVMAFGIFHLIDRDVGEEAHKLAKHLSIDPENHYARILIEKATDMDPRSLRHLGFFSLFFAADLMIEGVGLWYHQTWAEYLVLVATGVFLPEEIIGMAKDFSWERLVLFLVNLAVFAFIVWLLVNQHRRKQKRAAQTAA